MAMGAWTACSATTATTTLRAGWTGWKTSSPAGPATTRSTWSITSWACRGATATSSPTFSPATSGFHSEFSAPGGTGGQEGRRSSEDLAQRAQEARDVLRPGRVAHQPDAPDLAGQRPQTGA